MALLRGEHPAELVARRFLRRTFRGNLQSLMSLINLGAVYYHVHRVARERQPRGCAGCEDSHADAFAIATARLARAGVFTRDPDILALPREIVRVMPLAT